MKLCYTNPLWPDYFADPFVLRVGDAYYAYGTAGPEHHGRQADGRFYPVLRSSDLVSWTYLGGALEPLPLAHAVTYWAPEVAQHDGRFCMFYSSGHPDGRMHQIRVAVAERPAGPFRDQGRVLLHHEPFSIDPHPFRDPQTGRWYLFFAKDYFDDRVGTGTAVVPLADDLLHAAGEVRPVVRAGADWQIYQRQRVWYGKTWDAWHTVEGPFVLYHAGRYWCLYSGGCWDSADYGVGCAVADRVLGPYTDAWNAHGPAVLRGIDGQVLGPGHNSVILAPDGRTRLCVYHAWDQARTRRRMCMDVLEMTTEGPRCNGPTTTPQQIELGA